MKLLSSSIRSAFSFLVIVVIVITITTMTDQSTAKMNKAALMDFFDNKFPELDGGDLYISGTCCD